MMMRPTLMATAMLTAGLLAVPASQALAFQPLPTTGADIRVLGAQIEFFDPLFLGLGWSPTTQGYTQIHFSEQEIELDGEDVGTFYDAVFRNNIDGTLLFGSRVVVFEDDDDDDDIVTLAEDEEEEEFELNHTQRNGFLGYTTAAGWYRETSSDLRAYAAAATSTFYSPADDVPLSSSFYNGNSVTFYSDISAEEGNPVSAWYVVKTNATAFALNGTAVLYQAEDGAPKIFTFDAAAPVPEPSEYAMMGVGLLLLGGVMRRRMRKGA